MTRDDTFSSSWSLPYGGGKGAATITARIIGTIRATRPFLESRSRSSEGCRAAVSRERAKRLGLAPGVSSARRSQRARRWVCIDQLTMAKMESFGKGGAVRRHLDAALLVALGGVWVWKVTEVVGRETRLVRRNLGWGYVVDLSIPAGLTAGVGLFFLVRRLLAPPR
jgi:hypothetical protein